MNFQECFNHIKQNLLFVVHLSLNAWWVIWPFQWNFSSLRLDESKFTSFSQYILWSFHRSSIHRIHWMYIYCLLHSLNYFRKRKQIGWKCVHNYIGYKTKTESKYKPVHAQATYWIISLEIQSFLFSNQADLHRNTIST